MSRSSLTAQSRALSKRLNAIPAEVLAELRPALIEGGNEVADAMRQLAEGSRDTGALIDSIEVTPPGGTTPAYSSDGGSRVVPPNAVYITVGNPDQRHGHLVEFGSTRMTDERVVHVEPQPFMRPAFRLKKARVQAKIARAVTKAIKKIAGGSK